MYTGSMIGAGLNVFAVWGYVIANAVKGHVELNPKLLAMILGCDEDDIVNAIEYLETPDASSRSAVENGRRLIREGQFLYRVPTQQKYEAMRDEDARREYNRQKQARYRSRKAASVTQTVTNGNCVPACTHTDTETETETETNTPRARGNEKRTPTAREIEAFDKAFGGSQTHKLEVMAEDYPEAWILQAITLARLKRARKAEYALKILQAWAIEGGPPKDAAQREAEKFPNDDQLRDNNGNVIPMLPRTQ